MPEICYRPQQFRDATLEIIAHAQRIIDDYAEQGLSLTLRQLYYRFVAADLLPNTQKSYSRLGSIVSDARLAGLLDWEAIEDRGRQLRRSPHWNSIGGILAACASQYAVDRWEGQEYRVEVWVEKQALESVVGRAAEQWDVPYFACKGYTSQSEMWRAARRFERYERDDQRPVIVHLGDHSGIDMTRDITDRLNELFGVDVEVRRIALNMDQVRQHNPPPNPAKLSDSRAAGYIAEYGRSSWELDALEPRTLDELIQDTITDYVDMDLYDAQVERELEGQERLRELADEHRRS